MVGYAACGADVAITGVAICLSKDGKAEKFIRDFKGVLDYLLIQYWGTDPAA